MGSYLVRRLIGIVPLLFGVSIILFVLIHLPPGGPADIYASSGGMNSEDLARIEENLGLDDPLPVQFTRWLASMVTGDWGNSFKDGRPVTQTIMERLPATLELMVASSLISILVAIPVGIVTATTRRPWLRYAFNMVTMLGISVPTFWTGLIIILVFSGKLGWIPTGGRGDQLDGLERLRHLVGPTLVLVSVSVASWARFIHSSMIEVMLADYVRTARAKGLSQRVVVLRHAFRNAGIPFVTLLGLEIPKLFSGALVTEVVFSWPGIGRLVTESLLARDYPVLMGVFMLTAVAVVVGSLLADLLYGVVNPTITF